LVDWKLAKKIISQGLSMWKEHFFQFFE